MPLHHISDLNDPRVALFRDVADPELMRKHGLFVAEGRAADRVGTARAA
jgi:hypothetical protein